ncbi:MAG: hypothetical protein WD607_02600 [Candidatus Paceibacterota bacterium]
MIKAINYLYYRYYRLVKSISLKSSYFQVRVVFFFSMITGSNIVSAIKIANIEIDLNRYLVIAIGVVWFFFWLFFFSKSTYLESALKRFEKESTTHRFIGGIGVILYSIASFTVFINVMFNSS